MPATINRADELRQRYDRRYANRRVRIVGPNGLIYGTAVGYRINDDQIWIFVRCDVGGWRWRRESETELV